MTDKNLNSRVKNIKNLVNSRRAVFMFGRFQPPTKGHGKLVDMVTDLAQRANADPYVIPSMTVDKLTRNVDKNKNPLPVQIKIKYLKKFFPKVDIIESIQSPWHALDWFKENEYTDLVMVVGDDRKQEFETRLKTSATSMFNSFEVVSAERDPASIGISGMSATKARKAAIENDVDAFKAATGWKGKIALKLMRDIRREIGILKDATRNKRINHRELV